MSYILNYCKSFFSYSNETKRTSGAAYKAVKAKDSFYFNVVENGY